MRLISTLFFIGMIVCWVTLALAQTPMPSGTPAPGAIPGSVSGELVHVLAIISGYNILMSALQRLFSKGVAPAAGQLEAAAKAAGQAAVTAAVQSAAQPTVTAVQSVASAGLTLVNALSANQPNTK